MVPWKKQPWEITKGKSIAATFLLLCFTNLLWLIIRTGTKPSRITYPCQKAAATNFSLSLGALFPISLTALTVSFAKASSFFSKNKNYFLAIPLLVAIGGGLYANGLFGGLSNSQAQEFQLVFESQTATGSPASDIYVVTGRSAAHVTELISLMGSHDLLFYQSPVTGTNQGPTGLIAHDDVVLLKINCQWDERGGTNTDVLIEVIQAIIDHPDGFVGEIVVADNGQGVGSMDWGNANAEDPGQSSQDVVDMFSSEHNVSTFSWQNIRHREVEEYYLGDDLNGYVLYPRADSNTGIIVSYPKFRTAFGTEISFKRGFWNGTAYTRPLKVINMPVLKSHFRYGVTAALKNYMGVQSEGINGGLANGHVTIATGGMGTLMVETAPPTLTILDAIWVNANPYPASSTGPPTAYDDATRVNVLLASVDPAALDYWAAKHVLMQTAGLLGYTDTHTLDPENTQRSGLEEAFGVYLDLTLDALIRGGHNVTTNEDHMNVFVQEGSSSSTSPTSSLGSSSPTSAGGSLSSGTSTGATNGTSGFGVVGVMLGLAATIVFLVLKRKRKTP
ncbi:MAG: DUF362 domain-containing protein [Candidatus Heimdallarchaeota archaeon]